MLNVHHLTYHNDNKPWQYDKEELLLLCKDCHAKRHEKLNTNIDYKNDGILENNKDDIFVYGLAFVIIAIIVSSIAALSLLGDKLI